MYVEHVPRRTYIFDIMTEHSLLTHLQEVSVSLLLFDFRIRDTTPNTDNSM
jgi:hypothetical protein